MDTHQRSWSLVVVALAALCQVAVRPAAGSHAPRSRARPAPSALRPLLLLESNQPLEGLAASDDAALRELDQLLNMLQAKGKRSQDLADKGLTRDLVTQVLQPGGAGMWFGPRLGRRKRSVQLAHLSQLAQLPVPPLQDADVDNDIPWKLAELLRELQQGPKRSPAPCDPSEINCLLASIASTGIVASEQEQRPRSEGNLVNFTPRLGRESGEASDAGEATDQNEEAEGNRIGVGAMAAMGASRQLRTDGEPIWGFSPRLGRRLLPPGAEDVHAPASGPASGRTARSTTPGQGEANKEHAQARP